MVIRDDFVEELTKMYLDNYEAKKTSIRYRLINVSDAEDALQEAYARALEFWYTYSPENGPLEAWFQHILNQCVSYFLNFYKYRGTSSNNRNRLDYINIKFVDFKDQQW